MIAVVRRALGLLVVAVGLVGCRAPDEVIALADAQAEKWRTVRTEGRSWSDELWNLRLRQYAANARGVAEYVRTGKLAKETAIRFTLEERGRE